MWVALAFLLASTHGDVTKGNFGARRPRSPAAEIEKGEPSDPKEKRRKSYPYYGFLEEVAADQKAIILKGKEKNRVILVTSQTRVWNSSRKGSLKELVPGARVSGSVQKNEAGKEEALSIRFGKRRE